MPTATASGRRKSRRGGVLAALALVITASAIYALAFDRTPPTPTGRTAPARSTPTRPLAIVSDSRHKFASMAELVDASDLVVSGRVVTTEAGRVFGGGASGSAAIRSHVLTVRVDSVLAGSSSAGPDLVVLVEEEAELTDGTPVTVDGMRASRVGDDGIWFLVASGDPEFPGYAVVNSQGRYLRGAGETLRGGDASDALVGQLERLGDGGLAAAVARHRRS